jgi:hypothetical protein
VYRGSETKVQLNDLEPGADYIVRVCPVRQTGIGDLPGAYSPPSTFSTLMPDLVTVATTRTVTHVSIYSFIFLSFPTWNIGAPFGVSVITHIH